MGISAGVGISKHKDSYQAGYEAARMAADRIHPQKPNIFFAFTSVAFDQQEVIRGIRDVGERVPVVGCTDAGEITNEGPAKKSVAVMGIWSDSVMFTPGCCSDTAASPREKGHIVAKEVRDRTPDPIRAFIMFPDVLTANGAEIVRGTLDILGEHFLVIGGAAGDDFLFEKTFQYCNDQVMTGTVSGVGLSGSFTMGIGVRHGWVPIGIPKKVTKSTGAVVEELDGKPAVRIYEEYFGKDAEDLRKEPLARLAITYPLGIKISETEEYLIRDPITVDEKGAITCAAEIPEGSEVRLMIGSKEKAVEAAQDAARHLMDDFEAAHAAPKFVLMFNCIAREKLFGARAKDEIDAVMNIIGRDVPLLGFYTYGEQAPSGGESRNPEKINSRFYNETMVMFGVGE